MVAIKHTNIGVIGKNHVSETTDSVPTAAPRGMLTVSYQVINGYEWLNTKQYSLADNLQ